jgi:hypothetical protein
MAYSLSHPFVTAPILYCDTSNEQESPPPSYHWVMTIGSKIAHKIITIDMGPAVKQNTMKCSCPIAFFNRVYIKIPSLECFFDEVKAP